jgi:hypothetical protein
LSDRVRVYINGKPVDVAPDATALDAVRVFDPASADLLQSGERALADSRGLPIGADVTVYAGLILRVVSGRRARDETRET